MATLLTRLKLHELSLVDHPANEDSKVSIFKNRGGGDSDPPRDDPAGARPGDLKKKEGSMPGEAEKITALEAQTAELTKKLDASEAALKAATGEVASVSKERDEAKQKLADAEKAAEIAKGDESFETEGIVVKKSDVGETSFKIMKAQAERIELAAFEKSAESGDFAALPGEPIAKAKGLRGIAKLAKEDREVIEAMLKAGAAAIRQTMSPSKGSKLSLVAKGADKLDELTKARMEKHSGETYAVAQAAVLNTPEGKAAYAESRQSA